MTPVSTQQPSNEIQSLQAQLHDLSHKQRGLESRIQEFLASDRQNLGQFMHLMARRSSLHEKRVSILVRWMTLLSRNLGEHETRLEQQAKQLFDHEDGLRLVGQMLKDLDDPYGYGLSLDERIAGEGLHEGSRHRDVDRD